MITKNTKKKAVYTEKYKRGVFQSDKRLVCMWGADDEVFQELVEAGRNDDDTEFVTIRFNNLKLSTQEYEKSPKTIEYLQYFLDYLKRKQP